MPRSYSNVATSAVQIRQSRDPCKRIWGLSAGQNTDEFAVWLGAAGTTQTIDSENAAEQLRPQHARSSAVRRIGIVDGVDGVHIVCGFGANRNWRLWVSDVIRCEGAGKRAELWTFPFARIFNPGQG
jgi:hypothetical protein